MNIPVLAVKGDDDQRFDGNWVQAADIDTEAVGVGAGYIEGTAAAMSAEIVLGGVRVESIEGKILLALNQSECAGRDYEMQVACSSTH